MALPTQSLLLALFVLHSLESINGFGLQPKGSLSSLLSEHYRGATSSRLKYQNEEITSSVTGSIQVDNNEKKNKDDREWGLLEEWALQDSVPRYTTGSNVATFWTQLKHSTPELARWTAGELEDRYREFYSQSKDSLLVECGRSPTLLSDWFIASSKTNSNSVDKVITMGGSLLNGSEIYFPLKCAGTLGEDPMKISASEGIYKDALDDCYISTFMTLHTSSYAESTGGIVYELGFPRCEANKIHGPRNASGRTHVPRTSSKEVIIDPDDQVALDGQLGKLRQSFVSTATHNAGAILAASTLSACVALGHAAREMSSQTDVIATRSVVRDSQGSLVAHAAAAKHSSSTGSDKSERSKTTAHAVPLSVSERLAQAELEVGIYKRNLALQQERLEADELNFNELLKEESSLEAVERGFQNIVKE